MTINSFNRGNSLSRITGNVSVYSSIAGPLSGGNAANGLQPGNGYTYHTFTATGPLSLSAGPINSISPQFTTYQRSRVIKSSVAGSAPNATKTVQILLVGGGGGGYSQSGGGGGGVVHYTNLSLSGQITITVGGGGAVGSKGGDSSLSSPSMTTLSALGGGYWDYTTPTPVNRARVVGSGAGFTPDASGKTNNTAASPQILQPSQNPSYAGLSGFNQYGNPGGGGYANDYSWQGGGGGGAGGAGKNSPLYGAPSGNTGGDGLTVAPGTPNPAFYGPIIGVPSIAPLNGIYAGGGGGNNENYPSNPAPFGSPGGPGGGGACQGPSSGPTNAVQYSGSGGGAAHGGWYNPNPGPAGTGGDGIVIIRYV